MKKDVGVAYMLWFFLGIFSGHRFYLGRIGSAFAQLLTLGGVGVWLFADLFLIPKMVREHNESIAST